jgi:hypothetical protein
MLTPDELDEAYTRACQVMTELGTDKTELFLARLCLLLMKELGTPMPLHAAIDAARDSVRDG